MFLKLERCAAFWKNTALLQFSFQWSNYWTYLLSLLRLVKEKIHFEYINSFPQSSTNFAWCSTIRCFNNKYDVLKQEEITQCPGFFLNLENNSSYHRQFWGVDKKGFALPKPCLARLKFLMMCKRKQAVE